MLHTFGVVDVPRVAMVGIVEPDSLVIASWDEFLARGRVVHVSDGRNVVKVHLQGRLQLAGVKGVKAEMIITNVIY